MTAESPTAANQEESTAKEQKLFVGEESRGHALAEVFVEPEQVVAEVHDLDGGGCSVRVTPASNQRGITFQWLLRPAEARELVEDIREAIERGQ